MKKILFAVVLIVAAAFLWASASGCSMMNKGPAPAGHEMHNTGIESQTSD